MIVSSLQSDVVSIFAVEYSVNGEVVFSRQAGRTSHEDAARAWSYALVKYCSTVVLPAPLIPGTLEARQPLFQATLEARFRSTVDQIGLASALVAELGNLWLLPAPVVFPTGHIVTDVLLGQPAAVAGLLTLVPTLDPITPALSVAGVIDSYLRTITAVLPGAPPIIATLG